MWDLSLLIMALLCTGIAGGILAGLLGVGGGIVVVPMLEFTLGIVGVEPAIRMQIAVATSLAVIIPTSVSSARAHFLRQSVDLPLVKQWAAWILIGALVGSWVASQLHSRALSLLFACVALLMAFSMLRPTHRQRGERRRTFPFVVPAVPVLIGSISSMMGIGGGTLSVPAMTLLGKPVHTAVGTSALFGLFIAVPATIGFMITGWGNPLLPPGSMGFVSLYGLFLIAPASVLAAPLGARLAHNLPQNTLRLIFGSFLLLVAMRMIWASLIA